MRTFGTTSLTIMSNTDLKLDGGDLLNLLPFAQRLEKYLAVEKDYVDGGLVVSLAARFGSGKSTFLEMWGKSLKERRAKGDMVPMPIFLNAWESDYCGDPMVAILSGMLESIDEWKGSGKPEKSVLMEAAKDAAWLGLGIVNGFVASATGVDAVEVCKLVDEQRSERAEKIPDFIDLHAKKNKAMQELKSVLKESFGGEEIKVLVIVDELDRCRPDYAVSFLETVKHVFDIKGMAFILAVDYEQLSSSTRALYGASMNFEDYFRKFSHRTIRLPKPEENAHTMLLHEYVKKYVSIEGKRISGLNLESRISDIKSLTVGLGVNLRQLQEAFRLLGHVAEVEDPGRSGQYRHSFVTANILLSLIRVSQYDLYDSIRNESISHEDVVRELVRVLGLEAGQFWIAIYLSGVKPTGGSNPAEWAQKVAEAAGYTEATFDELETERFRHIFSGWGYGARRESRIQEIIQHLDGVDRFDKN